MEIPDLVQSSLGGEEVEAGVTLGDEDVVCLTPTRTLLYRAEGLLSDEKVEEFPHELERLNIEEGRRKTKFLFEYVDDTRSFGVPNNRDTQVLELVMDGILRVANVTDKNESVSGAFRFSELTMIITDTRVVKHIGSSVWSSDYEVYNFEDLTGLTFEQASVATEVILEVEGRPQRIKIPNEHARKVQQIIENVIFEYYDVPSLEALNKKIDHDDTAASSEQRDAQNEDSSNDIGLESDIDPLVSDSDDDETDDDDEADDSVESQSTDSDDPATTDTSQSPSDSEASPDDISQWNDTPSRASDGDELSSTPPSSELADVRDQLEELTTTVQQQNTLIKKQQKTIEQLIKELRQGR